jgi:hypothetical protein
MLNDLLVVSLILLGIVNVLVFFRSRRVRACLVVVGLFLVFAFALDKLFAFPPIRMLFPLLVVALVAWPVSRRWQFFPVSCMIATIVWGIAFAITMQREFEYDRLRDQFPYESMQARLPEPKSVSRMDRMPDATIQRLGRLEEAVDIERGTGGRERGLELYRARRLRRLHEDRVQLFVRGPGFGAGRMLFVPSEEGLRKGQRQRRLIPQQGPLVPSEESLETGRLALGAANEDKLYTLHESGVVDFAHPWGFGYLKDRRHVAGFQAHQFSEVPEPTESWVVHRLDLVGLLMYPQPVAYLSDHLPRMDELREAPTRPLDSFESAALERLRQGEDLHVVPTSGGLRMLGAIRSARQCVACHGGQRGDLLGAFSYILRQRDK